MTAPWDRRSTAEQQRVERLVLNRWLPAAVSFSGHWSRRAEELGIGAGDLETREDLRRFPPSRDRDLADAGGRGAPGLLMRPTEAQVKARASSLLLLRVAGAIRRGGASGKDLALLEEYKPIHVHHGGRHGDLVVASSRSDLDRLHRAGARLAAVLGLDEWDYLVSAVPAGPTLAFWGIYHLALGSSMLAMHPRAGDQPLDVALDAFSLVPATVVAVPVHEAVDLGRRLAESDGEATRIATVLTVGPPPAPADRVAIAEAWRAAGAPADVRVRALWAPAAARALWSECAEGTHGLHTFPDLETIELVDPLTGRVTDQDGDLTYTSSGWHGTALLRHQTGDYVEGIDHEPCPGCGRTVPRLAGEISPAAWEPVLDEASGTVDLRGVAAVLAPAGDVQAWRAELRSGPERLVVEVAGTLDAARADALGRQIAAATGIATVETALADAAHVEARVGELGGPFADAR